jgi:Dyp-type peroxidase family
VTARAVDLADVQGIVRYGYGPLTQAYYLLLRVRDARAAKRWLGATEFAYAKPVGASPQSALQIAFTAPGLRALGLGEATLAGFSAEFLSGMSAEASRSRRLGDTGDSAPSAWRWGYGDGVPDAVLMLFAQSGADELRDACVNAWGTAFDVIAILDTTDIGTHEQFGFEDGISQPTPDWEQRVDPARESTSYRNATALGEFLLGYPNEYGQYTDRPLLTGDPAADAALLPAADAPDKRDLGLNGTYVVLRDLRQDVRAFWRYAAGAAARAGLGAEQLAAAFVGRERDGTPLVQHADENAFRYTDDPDGLRCPFGAHIRRANPRNEDYARRPNGALGTVLAALGFGPRGPHEDLTSPVRFHRIVRRGREYGEELTPEEALAQANAPAPPRDPERGLRFVCINASILRQFEFVQNAWLRDTAFDGLSRESDPLLGSRAANADGGPTDAFTLPRSDALRARVTGLPRFVTVQGGAYFFLPSLRAVRYLASLGAASPGGNAS